MMQHPPPQQRCNQGKLRSSSSSPRIWRGRTLLEVRQRARVTPLAVGLIHRGRVGDSVRRTVASAASEARGSDWFRRTGATPGGSDDRSGVRYNRRGRGTDRRVPQVCRGSHGRRAKARRVEASISLADPATGRTLVINVFRDRAAMDAFQAYSNAKIAEVEKLTPGVKVATPDVYTEVIALL